MSTPITPQLETEMAWDHLAMAKEDLKASPSTEAYAEILSCLDALASVLHKQAESAANSDAPHEGDADLPINLVENAAQIETATTAWLVTRTSSDGYTLLFHPESRWWITIKEPMEDVKNCLLAMIENAEIALAFAYDLTPPDEETPRIAEMEIRPDRIVEKTSAQ